MQALSNKFLRALSIGLVGLGVAFVLALFVAMFMSSQHKGNSRIYGYGNTMMKNTVAPSVSITARPMMGDWNGNDGYAAAEKMRSGVMMDRTNDRGMMDADRKVMKDGNLSLRVKNVDETVSRVTEIAASLGGDIADSRLSRADSGTKGGTITVKIPVNRFQEALAKLKETAVVVLSENVSGTDVTAQYIDIAAHIANKKVAEASLQSLLDRAEKISDVIEITNTLAGVRGEIESLEGQLRYLNAQTDKASITLFLTEDVTVTADQSFRPVQALKESLVLLIGLFGNLTQGLIRFLVVGVPVLLIDGAILWGLYIVARRLVTKFWPGSLPEKRRILRRK